MSKRPPVAAALHALASICHDIGRHKLLALRAVLTGGIALVLLWGFLALRLANLDDWLFVTGLADIRHFWKGGRAPISHFLIGGCINFAVGWIVGRLHRGHRTAMVAVFFVSLLLLVDLPRVLPAVIEASHSLEALARFAGFAVPDFVFLRLPILGGFLAGDKRDSVREQTSHGIQSA